MGAKLDLNQEGENKHTVKNLFLFCTSFVPECLGTTPVFTWNV